MKMGGKGGARRLFIICVIVFFIILFIAINVQEVEIPGWEFNTSRNLNDYIHAEAVTAKLLPKDFCDIASFLVIICISSPVGFEARSAIRQTWGREKNVAGYNVSLYFLLGQTTDMYTQTLINMESMDHDDIIQEDFYDTYSNLTLKSSMMLKLFSLKCQGTASYLLKVDDDIYLNVPNLVENLVKRNKTENLLMGNVICGSRPIRSSRDKWYAGPFYLYPHSRYPNYMSGTSYCMSGDVAQKLLDAALTTPVFHLEDVYLTGLCAKKGGLNLTHNALFTFNHMPKNFCMYKVLITLHYQEPDDLLMIHNKLQDPKVDKYCQEEEQKYLIHKWYFDNVVNIRKTWWKKQCTGFEDRVNNVVFV